MNYGVYAPNFGDYADPERIVALAVECERAGWDGFFLYDHLAADAYGAHPGDAVADPWILLAAIACATQRIRLGPMVTPLARRRPAKLAREIATLDRLSGGRLIFGVGLGAEESYAPFGEDGDPARRAEKLDEGLEVLAGLLSGAPFSFEGRHHSVRDATFRPTPLQSPRVPIWVAGGWPRRRPFRRAAQWDGAFPLGRDVPVLTPDEIAQVADYVRERRTSDAAFDLVACGATDAGASVEAYARAGATWWFEWLEPDRGSFTALRERVLAGPPR